MQKLVKQTLSAVLALVMVASLFAVVPFSIFAAGNTANCTIIEPTNLTDDGKTENGTLWETKRKNLTVDSKYAETKVQVDNINMSTIAALGKNLVRTIKWGTTVETLGSIGVERTNNLRDGGFLDTNGSGWIPVNSATPVGAQSDVWTVSTSTTTGKDRFGTEAYDGAVVADLGSATTIDSIYAMLHYSVDFAWRTYKIYVSDSMDTLWDDANEVVLFDYYTGYTDGSGPLKLNGVHGGGTVANTRSEGQIWKFTGENKPVGRFIGYKIYQTAKTSNQMIIYELGATGSRDLDIIEPTLRSATSTITQSGAEWVEKLDKLKVGSSYPGTTLQVDNMNDASLAAIKTQYGNNKIIDISIAGSESYAGIDAEAILPAGTRVNITDGIIYDEETAGTNTGWSSSAFAFKPSEKVGAERFETGDYDALITTSLDKNTTIDTIYTFSHPGIDLSWCTYKIYVSSNKDTLYDNENEVAYFDYYNGYISGQHKYSLNGTHAAGDIPYSRRSEGQIWTFTGDEKPTGKYVGFKLFFAEAGAQYRNRVDIFDLGVFGSSYDDIETIHSDIVQIKPYNCELLLIPGKTVQFKAIAYGNAEITAVKVIKEGAEDVVLTDVNGVYTTPALEEGMKIKVETDKDATTPVNGVWNGVDLTKNSTAYDPQIWNSNVTYNEATMFYTGRTTAKLLYPIDEIVSVRSFDLQTVYYPGIDYVITPEGEFQIPEGSSIPVYENVTDFYNFVDYENGNYETDWNKISAWESRQWKYQTMITYTHTKTWGKGYMYETGLESQLDKMGKFVEKAQSGETTNIVFYGDSLSVGCSSTGLNEYSWRYEKIEGTNTYKDAKDLPRITVTKASTYGLDPNNLPDWVCETWPRALTNALKEQFGDNITYTNRCIGSTASTWGSQPHNLEFLLGKGDTETPCPTPDLLFIHYGLNEAGNSKELQKANTKKIMDYARTLNPDCVIVLMSEFYPPQYTKEENPQLHSSKIPDHEIGFYELAEEYEDVVVAPINSLTASIKEVKSPLDYTHNAFNHTNDFGTRIYASALISMFAYKDTCDVHTYSDCETDAKCNVCGAEKDTFTHTFGDYESDENATCQKDGTKTRVCACCDETETVEDTGSKKDHKYTDYVYNNDATCQKDGTKTALCDYDCGEGVDTITAEGTKDDHKYTAYAYNNDATCLKDGTETAVCDYGCGIGTHTVTATGTKKAHTYGANYVSAKATTSKDGAISKKCACGTVVKVSTIYRAKTISVAASVSYTGKEIKPKVTVKDSNGKTISSSYYTLKYSNNKKVGKATVTVTFKGNYSGSKKLTFKIVPKKTSISSLKAGKKSLTVKYKKQTSGTGYEIQYSTSKSFNSAKTVKISKNKTVSKTIKKLKSKKTYYVRVRVTKGSSYKSSWSSVKKIKVK